MQRRKESEKEKVVRERPQSQVQAQGVRGWGAVRALLLFHRALAGLLQALGRGRGAVVKAQGSTAPWSSVNQSSLPNQGR